MFLQWYSSTGKVFELDLVGGDVLILRFIKVNQTTPWRELRVSLNVLVSGKGQIYLISCKMNHNNENYDNGGLSM